MKNAFLISGFDTRFTATGEKLKDLRDVIASKGYNVVPVDISWRYITPTKFAEKFKKFYLENKSPDGNIVIGNSFGAVVSFITATELQPDFIMLCSLSPYFQEQLSKNWPADESMKRLGKTRLKDISTYSQDKISEEIKKLKIPVKVLYGEQEKLKYPKLVSGCHRVSRIINGTDAIEIENAPHSFRQPEYVIGIKRELI